MPEFLIAAIARTSDPAELRRTLSHCTGLEANRLSLFTKDHLREDMGISSDAAGYYNIAIDEGRSVIVYAATSENATSVERQFNTCGFVKIRRFALPEKVTPA